MCRAYINSSLERKYGYTIISLPFDLPEAEEELVTGYQTEYLGIRFGLFYVASYLNLLISSLFVTVLSLGGSNISIPYIFVYEFFEINKTYGVFGTTINLFITLAKTYFFLFVSIITRWSLPRLREKKRVLKRQAWRTKRW